MCKISLLIAALVLAVVTMGCGASMVQGGGMTASVVGPRTGAVDEIAEGMVETNKVRAYADANYRAAEADSLRAETEVRYLRGHAGAMTLTICNSLLAAAREQPMSKTQRLRCSRSMDQSYVLQMMHESNGWMVAYGGDPTGGLGGFGGMIEQSSYITMPGASPADRKYEDGLKSVAVAVNQLNGRVDQLATASKKGEK